MQEINIIKYCRKYFFFLAERPTVALFSTEVHDLWSPVQSSGKVRGGQLAGAGGGQLGHGQHLLCQGRAEERGAVHRHQAGQGGVARVPLPRHQVTLHQKILAPRGPGHSTTAGLGNWQKTASHAESRKCSKVHRVLSSILHSQTQT